MTRVSYLCAAVCAIGLVPGLARAQPPGVLGGGAGSRPVYSPYLNLARRDVPPGINYYGIERPQVAAQSGIQSLQQQQQLLAQAQRLLTTGPSPTANEALPVTGQQVTFLNTGGYFLNAGAGGPITGPVVSRGGRGAPRR